MVAYSKFIKDTGIVGVTGVAKALREIILLPVLIKTLGAEAYGTWTQIAVTITLLVPLLSAGLPFALVRFLAAESDTRKIQDGIWSVATLLAGAGLGATLLFFLFSTPLAAALNLAPPFITILGLIVLLEILNLVFLNVFRAFQLIRNYAVFAISQILAEVILVSLVVLAGYGIEGALLVWLGVKFALCTTAAITILLRFGVSLPRFEHARRYLAFALPTVPGNVAAWVVLASDRYLIHFFLGLVFVGYYAPAATIGGFLILLVSPLAFIMPSVLSKLADEDKQQLVRQYLAYTFKWFLLIAIPSVFGLSVLAKHILALFSTPEAVPQSFLIVPLSALSFLFFGTMVFFAQPLILQKKTKPYGFIWLAIALFNVILNFFFIPAFGILGAALTTLIAYAAGSMLLRHSSQKYWSFPIPWLQLAKSILAAGAMALFILLVRPESPLTAMLMIPFGIVLYGFFLVFFKSLDRREMLFFRTILRKLS